MRRLLGTVAAALIGAVAFTSTVEAASRFWDPETKKWVSARGGGKSGRSPIKRKVVKYNGKYKAGTIVVSTEERRLYHILPNGKAMKYGIGVGRPGFTWAGTHRVTRKAEWPGWTPPASMRARERRKGRILPAYMPGGPRNPLGARALYLGSSIYRIHGSNEPRTIGQAVSSGCIRMANEDVKYLYEQVSVGARVVVLN
ncbi:MAG: L,D-transpeptidase [Stappiaceae bacterium]